MTASSFTANHSVSSLGWIGIQFVLWSVLVLYCTPPALQHPPPSLLSSPPRPHHHSPWVRLAWLNFVDLNIMYLHLTTRLSKSCSMFDLISWFWTLLWRCFTSLRDELKLQNWTAYHCDSATAGSVFDLLWLWTLQCPYMNSVSTLLRWIYNSKQTLLFFSCFIFLPQPTNGCKNSKEHQQTLPPH